MVIEKRDTSDDDYVYNEATQDIMGGFKTKSTYFFTTLYFSKY